MKAVRIHQFGGPEVLNYEDVPDPKPRKDQVLVRVRACALNHLDLWVRKGLPGVNLPHIPWHRHRWRDRRSRRLRHRLQARTTCHRRAHEFLQSLREVRCRDCKINAAISPSLAMPSMAATANSSRSRPSTCPYSRFPRFQRSGQRAAGLPYRLAHAHRARRHSSRPNRPRAGREFRRRHCQPSRSRRCFMRA